MLFLPRHDPEVAAIIRREEARIEDTLDLIAAENHAPRSIFEAQGSIFSTKAAEGYPGNRFHAGPCRRIGRPCEVEGQTNFWRGLCECSTPQRRFSQPGCLFRSS